MTKTFVIEWMTFNGTWRVTAKFADRKSANAVMKKCGLIGNPAYRVKKVS